MSLQALRNKLFGGTTQITSLFYLAKELGCLSDIVGRDYEGEIIINGEKVEFKFRQKPLKVTQIKVLLQELNAHNKREQKEMRKGTK